MIPPNIVLYHEYEKYPGLLTDTSAEMVSLVPKSTKQLVVHRIKVPEKKLNFMLKKASLDATWLWTLAKV